MAGSASAAFLIALWRPQWCNYFALATKRNGTVREHYIKRDRLDEVGEWLEDNADRDCYFTAHGLTRPKRCEAHAYESHLLWADLDPVNPRTLLVRPSIAWRTSRWRFQAIWRCDGEPSRGLRRGFNQAIGADTGWHYAKLLRIPGTLNFKYKPPVRGKLLWDDGPTHRLRDLAQYEAGDEHRSSVNLDAPDVHLLDVTAILAKYAGKIDPTLLDAAVDGRDGAVPRGGRFKIIWKLGQKAKAAGATPDEIGTLVYHSRAWQSKHGPDSHGRLGREVARILTKD
jgi:hypothetical protein